MKRKCPTGLGSWSSEQRRIKGKGKVPLMSPVGIFDRRCCGLHGKHRPRHRDAYTSGQAFFFFPFWFESHATCPETSVQGLWVAWVLSNISRFVLISTPACFKNYFPITPLTAAPPRKPQQRPREKKRQETLSLSLFLPLHLPSAAPRLAVLTEGAPLRRSLNIAAAAIAATQPASALSRPTPSPVHRPRGCRLRPIPSARRSAVRRGGRGRRDVAVTGAGGLFQFRRRGRSRRRRRVWRQRGQGQPPHPPLFRLPQELVQLAEPPVDVRDLTAGLGVRPRRQVVAAAAAATVGGIAAVATGGGAAAPVSRAPVSRPRERDLPLLLVVSCPRWPA